MTPATVLGSIAACVLLCPSRALAMPQASGPSSRVAIQSGSSYGFNNIRAFGAKGDGTSDDRLAIQAAIDDAAANHRLHAARLLR